MIETYIEIDYKEQGNEVDSWTISEWEDDTKAVLIDRRMVYEDPGTAEEHQTFLGYEKKAKDGLKAYLKLMSEFVTAGTPRNVNRNLENKLETVRNEIVSGQWISALEKLDNITPSGDLTTEIYDRIQLSLTTYIENNY